MSRSVMGGGAERVALNLHREYRRAGHEAELRVGEGMNSTEPGATVLSPRGLLSGFDSSLRARGRPRAARLARALTAPGVAVDALLGREDFRFPATLDTVRAARDFDIAQLHNLHGAYFDLRCLPELSATTPVVLTPHDMWLATGHCAHSLDCERWATTCGSCPHLRVYPALLRDGTAGNRRRKADIYRRSEVRVGVPSRWLASILERSIVAPAVTELRVIPNGIDLELYRPGDRAAARHRLRVPEDALVLVYVAQGARRNDFKDYPTLEAALRRFSPASARPVVLFALGAEETATTFLGSSVEIRSPGRVPEREVVDHLQAADLYVHPARAETFPLAVLEALACGVPVVASAVGGIVEQVSVNTGVLVGTGDPDELAAALQSLADDPARRRAMGAAAVVDAHSRFGLRIQARRYLEWFAEIMDSVPQSHGSRGLSP